MSESAAQKRSVDEVSTPEVADTKKSKATDVKESEQAEAGPSTGDNDVEETEVDEDELAALDTANIISGPRTRGKKIDFRKASEEAGGDDDDEDDDDADVTANTTALKDDEGTSDEEDEEAEAEAPAAEEEAETKEKADKEDV